MTFLEAMTEVANMAINQNRIVYLYKGNGGKSKWWASLAYWNDWLFKAWPGGRKVLSVEGTKILQAERRRTSGAVDGGEGSDLQAESTPAPKSAPEVLPSPTHHH